MLLIIDGPHLLFRSCYAHSELVYERNGEVFKSGGVYGFLQSLRCAHRDLGSESVVVVCWEDPVRSRSVRKMLSPVYKQKREPGQEVDFGVVELREFVKEQLTIIQPLLKKVGVLQAYAPMFEADDVAATLCEQMHDEEIVLMSGDKDWWQNISDDVSVMRPKKEGYEFITKASWPEEHKVAVGQWAEVLALMGDDVDNIIGVHGIGVKTAEKLIAEYNDLEGVIAAAQAGKVKRFSGPTTDKDGNVHQGIPGMVDQLRMNLKLTRLNRDADLVWDSPDQDEEAVSAFFRYTKMVSFTSGADLDDVMRMGVASW